MRPNNLALFKLVGECYSDPLAFVVTCFLGVGFVLVPKATGMSFLFFLQQKCLCFFFLYLFGLRWIRHNEFSTTPKTLLPGL